jgi:hypothetical protein
VISSTIVTACRGTRRWFDLDAVRTEHTQANPVYVNRTPQPNPRTGWAENNIEFHQNPAGAPPLDWHQDGDLGTGHIILATAPYPGSHYATFPPELPRKIIDSMCPRQVCRVCGVPRERIAVTTNAVGVAAGRRSWREGGTEGIGAGHVGVITQSVSTTPTAQRETLGWSDCGHDNYRSGLVLDPFAGTATSLMAAQDLGRDAIGIDLDERNADLARSRVGMFLEVDHFSSEVVS